VRPLRELGLDLSRADAGPPVPDSATAAVLGCVARLHVVTLNGKALTDVDLSFYRHPGNASRGVVAYIPSAALARGRNVITVQQAPRLRRGRLVSPPPAPHVIPFWY
jgi:hypothetical protein